MPTFIRRQVLRIIGGLLPTGVLTGCVQSSGGTDNQPSTQQATANTSTPSLKTQSTDRTSATTTPAPSTLSSKTQSRRTTVRKTNQNLSAIFEAEHSDMAFSEAEKTAAAKWKPAANQVIVTGTIISTDCHRLALESMDYNQNVDTLELVIAMNSKYTKTRTIACGVGPFEYRTILSTNGDLPNTIKVAHEYPNQSNTFTLNN